MTNLAILYSEGSAGVKKNFKEAVRLLTHAANEGHTRAQTRLANHLFYGRGCEKNQSEAFRWYSEAASEGSVAAMSSLGKCYEYGYGCELDISKAIEWYERAALWGDVVAFDKLIVLVANPNVLDDICEHGYVAPAA